MVWGCGTPFRHPLKNPVGKILHQSANCREGGEEKEGRRGIKERERRERKDIEERRKELKRREGKREQRRKIERKTCVYACVCKGKGLREEKLECL